MPQTRFVLEKALAQDLTVIIVINKVDRPDARLDEVVDDSCGLKVPLAVSADQVEIDADRLAEKILFLLRNSKEAGRFGRNGRRRFVEKYSSKVFGRNMSAFYESLFAEEKYAE